MSGAFEGCGMALRACLALGLFTLAAAHAGQAAQPAPPTTPVAFAIAAQPLAQALVEYSLASGLTVLVDSTLTAGRQAPAVIGNYTPGDALRKLLAGSPLAIRYASSQSFTLVATEQEAATAPRSGKRLRDTPYAAVVQGALKRALCKAAGTQPGSYRALVQLWFDKGWRVSRVGWVASTGAPALDGRLEAALRGVVIGPLPASMPQPLTVLLSPRSAAECAELSGAGHAG
ncbi:STN domain-containing protein [Achromobacter marplatensis]|uniref:STN domain-containing protein n=1 Tax=Achromobacter marplatensis TaxID=470868 RepID=UPI0039F64E24